MSARLVGLMGVLFCSSIAAAAPLMSEEMLGMGDPEFGGGSVMLLFADFGEGLLESWRGAERPFAPEPRGGSWGGESRLIGCRR